jgi:hypothetical protein
MDPGTESIVLPRRWLAQPLPGEGHPAPRPLPGLYICVKLPFFLSALDAGTKQVVRFQALQLPRLTAVCICNFMVDGCNC